MPGACTCARNTSVDSVRGRGLMAVVMHVGAGPDSPARTRLGPRPDARRSPYQPDRFAGPCGLLQRGERGGAAQRRRAGRGGRRGGRVHPNARRPAAGLAGAGAPRAAGRRMQRPAVCHWAASSCTTEGDASRRTAGCTRGREWNAWNDFHGAPRPGQLLYASRLSRCRCASRRGRSSRPGARRSARRITAALILSAGLYLAPAARAFIASHCVPSYFYTELGNTRGRARRRCACAS